MASSFSFDAGRLRDIDELDKKINRALYGVVRYWDGRIESHMKQKAPWHDRTTNARNGLSATSAKLGPGHFVIYLVHSVTYGIYLERGTRYMKARPIILPSLRIFSPKVMQMMSKLMDRL